MIPAILINLAWIMWSLYKFLTRLGIYMSIYLGAYSIFLIAGLPASVSGSIFNKVLYFGKRKSRWVKA